MTSRDFPSYFHADPARPVRDRALPDECPAWLQVAAPCFLAVAAGLLFMAAVSSLYFPF